MSKDAKELLKVMYGTDDAYEAFNKFKEQCEALLKEAPYGQEIFNKILKNYRHLGASDIARYPDLPQEIPAHLAGFEADFVKSLFVLRMKAKEPPVKFSDGLIYLDHFLEGKKPYINIKEMKAINEVLGNAIEKMYEVQYNGVIYPNKMLQHNLNTRVQNVMSYYFASSGIVRDGIDGAEYAVDKPATEQGAGTRLLALAESRNKLQLAKSPTQAMTKFIPLNEYANGSTAATKPMEAARTLAELFVWVSNNNLETGIHTERQFRHYELFLPLGYQTGLLHALLNGTRKTLTPNELDSIATEGEITNWFNAGGVHSLGKAVVGRMQQNLDLLRNQDELYHFLEDAIPKMKKILSRINHENIEADRPSGGWNGELWEGAKFLGQCQEILMALKQEYLVGTARSEEHREAVSGCHASFRYLMLAEDLVKLQPDLPVKQKLSIA